MKTLPESQKVCFFSPAVQFLPVHPRCFSGSFHSVQRILTQTAKALNTSVSGRSVYTGESTKVLQKTKNNEARRAEREENKMKNNMKEINMKELSMEEMENVSGGCIWCIAGLCSTAVWIGGIAYLYYLKNKND